MYSADVKRRARQFLDSDLDDPTSDRYERESRRIELGDDQSDYLRRAYAEHMRRRLIQFAIITAVVIVALIVLAIVVGATGVDYGGYGGDSD